MAGACRSAMCLGVGKTTTRGRAVLVSNTRVPSAPAPSNQIESPYAWLRLVVSLLLMTIGGSGMYAVTVVLPRIQADFGIARADASLPYTLTMIGFGAGGVMMGRLADRFGVLVPVAIGGVGLGAGFIAAGLAPNIWLFCAAQGALVGLLGTSATFAPLVADTSQWFDRRRGIALAICMSGNYMAGAVWPPVMQYFIERGGWRSTYVGMGVFCLATILPLALLLRRRPPRIVITPAATGAATVATPTGDRPMGLSPNAALALLSLAGVACCVAMSMPQVHIVAYCGDLGIGPARGAQMLSLMLGLGVVSRLASGWISDRIGGLRTLLLGSMLQGIALLLFLPFDGVVSLYVVSGLFGLFQGGIVPSYALIVREHFSPAEAGARVGTVLMATLFGMALGGWLSGAVFDWTGSYHAAFLNGIGWNLLNLAIAGFLLRRVLVSRRADAMRGMVAQRT
jgi:MFS family permease